jgi:hypothetical protein
MPSAFAVSHQTAPHGAAERGLTPFMKFLAENGAALQARDANGRTTLEAARGAAAAAGRPMPSRRPWPCSRSWLPPAPRRPRSLPADRLGRGGGHRRALLVPTSAFPFGDHGG